MKAFKRLLILSIIVLTSCNFATMKLNEKFRNVSTMHDVTGRQGFMIDRVLEFSNFKTSETNSSSYDEYIPLNKELKGVHQSFTFTQYDPSGNQLFISCYAGLEKFKTERLEKNSSASERDIFTATIKMPSIKKTWDLQIENAIIWKDVLQFGGAEKINGLLKSSEKEFILKPVRGFEQDSFIPNPNLSGFEFQYENQTIAAVEILGNGKVWFHGELSPEDKHVIASACSAILLKGNLERAFPN